MHVLGASRSARGRRRRRRGGSRRRGRRCRRRSGGLDRGRRCRRRSCSRPAGRLRRMSAPVTSASASRAAVDDQEPVGGGPDDVAEHGSCLDRASWPGSPTRTRRASGRTASTSLAISDSETIEVSSTMTTSWGSRWPRWWRKRLWLPGRQPSSRCSVEACSASSAVADGFVDRELGRLLVYRFLEPRRGLAGGGGERDQRRARPLAAACSASSATIRATVVVLPVPGPPATTANRRSTAARCREGLAAPGLAREEAGQPFLSTRPRDVRRRLLADGAQVGGDCRSSRQ